MDAAVHHTVMALRSFAVVFAHGGDLRLTGFTRRLYRSLRLPLLISVKVADALTLRADRPHIFLDLLLASPALLCTHCDLQQSTDWQQ